MILTPLPGSADHKWLYETSRRPELPREHPVAFSLRRTWEIASTYAAFGWYWLKLERLRRRIEREPRGADYTDAALTPVEHSGGR